MNSVLPGPPRGWAAPGRSTDTPVRSSSTIAPSKRLVRCSADQNRPALGKIVTNASSTSKRAPSSLRSTVRLEPAEPIHVPSASAKRTKYEGHDADQAKRESSAKPVQQHQPGY